MSTLIEQLLNLPSPLALSLITLLVFGEAAVFVGFVLPGETAVLLGGVLASTGHLPLLELLAAVVIAAILGDSAGYEIGRRFGTRLLTLRLLRRHHARITTARKFLRERGGGAVFLGRFTAFLRAAMPALAGISHMPYPRFLAYNAAGALVWGLGISLLGYLVGASYPQAERFLGPSNALLVLVVVLAGAYLWRHGRSRQRKQTSDAHLDSPQKSSTGAESQPGSSHSPEHRTSDHPAASATSMLRQIPTEPEAAGIRGAEGHIHGGMARALRTHHPAVQTSLAWH